MPKGAEKRKEKRIKVRLPVKIFYRGSEFTGETDNISRLGTYIETTKNMPLGAEVRITIALPLRSGKIPAAEISSDSCVFRCSLIREEGQVKYYGLGVFFAGFPQQADRDKLSAFIDLLASQEEENVKKEFKHLKARRAASERGRVLWQANTAKCLIALKQILNTLQELYRLAESKNKGS